MSFSTASLPNLGEHNLWTPSLKMEFPSLARPAVLCSPRAGITGMHLHSTGSGVQSQILTFVQVLYWMSHFFSPVMCVYLCLFICWFNMSRGCSSYLAILLLLLICIDPPSPISVLVLLFRMLRTHPSVARLLLAYNLKYIHVLVHFVGDVSKQEPST